MVIQIPSFTLNNGNKIPAIGLGTYQAKSEEAREAVEYAIDCGYRHFDIALYYDNESDVGKAINKKIQEGVITRQDVFVTSKLWCNSMTSELVEPAIRKTLSNLGLDYLDLYLIHWPMAFKEGDELIPKSEEGKVIFSDADYVCTWKGMELIYRKELSKSIGVSNFNKRQIERLIKTVKVLPAVNQIECHPYLNQNKLIKLCKENNIITTGYSPLGSPYRAIADSNQPVVMENPKIKEIASKYNKTPAQVCLRYQVQKHVVPIPKSSRKERIKQNIAIFDFELSKGDMNILNSLDCNKRFHNMDRSFGHREHPFENDEY